MPRRVFGDTFHQPPSTLASAAPHLRAGVRLIDNHEFRRGLPEHGGMSVRLDVVERHDRKRVVLEDREGLVWDVALEPVSRSRRDGLGCDVEMPFEFRNPLVDKRRRA